MGAKCYCPLSSHSHTLESGSGFLGGGAPRRAPLPLETPHPSPSPLSPSSRPELLGSDTKLLWPSCPLTQALPMLGTVLSTVRAWLSPESQAHSSRPVGAAGSGWLDPHAWAQLGCTLGGSRHSPSPQASCQPDCSQSPPRAGRRPHPRGGRRPPPPEQDTGPQPQSRTPAPTPRAGRQPPPQTPAPTSEQVAGPHPQSRTLVPNPQSRTPAPHPQSRTLAPTPRAGWTTGPF